MQNHKRMLPVKTLNVLTKLFWITVILCLGQPPSTQAQPAGQDDDDFAGLATLSSRPMSDQALIERIAFGSCYAPQLEQPTVWDVISNYRPDMLLLMGDNVYQSEEKVEPGLVELREAYAMLGQESQFTHLRETTSILSTWDDHDYGLNDAGTELPVKLQSEALFEHVWPLPYSKQEARASREGIYHAGIFGPPGKRIQVIMLDTRFFRSSLNNVSETSTLLGSAQWDWLEAQLKEQAEVRILVSSIPVLSQRNQGETWHKMPAQRTKLLQLIKETKATNLVILSGDTHFAAFFCDRSTLPFPLWEVTASSLNFPMPKEVQAKEDSIDAARDGDMIFNANFGLFEMSWDTMQARLSIHDSGGAWLRSVLLPLGH